MNWENRDDLSESAGTNVASKPEIAQALSASRDDIIEELGRIDQYISQKNEEINLLRNRKKHWEEILIHIEALFSADNNQVDKQVPGEAANSVSITDAAFAFLERTHSPKHYKEIARKLQADNVYIPGKNPSATLLSRISRDKRFKRGKKRGEYALSVWRIRKKSRKPKRKLKMR